MCGSKLDSNTPHPRTSRPLRLLPGSERPSSSPRRAHPQLKLLLTLNCPMTSTPHPRPENSPARPRRVICRPARGGVSNTVCLRACLGVSPYLSSSPLRERAWYPSWGTPGGGWRGRKDGSGEPPPRAGRSPAGPSRGARTGEPRGPAHRVPSPPTPARGPHCLSPPPSAGRESLQRDLRTPTLSRAETLQPATSSAPTDPRNSSGSDWSAGGGWGGASRRPSLHPRALLGGKIRSLRKELEPSDSQKRGASATRLPSAPPPPLPAQRPLPGWLCGTVSSGPPPTSRLRPAGYGWSLDSAGPRGRDALGKRAPGPVPARWGPPGPPPTATATATASAAVTHAHTRARSWQHRVSKPPRSPLVEPRRMQMRPLGPPTHIVAWRPGGPPVAGKTCPGS